MFFPLLVRSDLRLLLIVICPCWDVRYNLVFTVGLRLPFTTTHSYVTRWLVGFGLIPARLNLLLADTYDCTLDERWICPTDAFTLLLRCPHLRCLTLLLRLHCCPIYPVVRPLPLDVDYALRYRLRFATRSPFVVVPAAAFTGYLQHRIPITLCTVIWLQLRYIYLTGYPLADLLTLLLR